MKTLIEIVPILGLFVALFGAFWGVYVHRNSKNEERIKEQQLRNRLTIINRVKSFWVKEVLEKSLHNKVMIEIGLVELKDIIENPWDMVFQTSNPPEIQLPVGMKISDFFETSGQSLVILGGPGAGKTTMLLELARDATNCAETDSTKLIPVVFNLSSWTNPRQTIFAWLIDEFKIKYKIEKEISISWLENNELLLLLDGLDEVQSEQQSGCVKAINDFLHEYGMTSLAICCRSEVYEKFITRLNVQRAISLQPLSTQQIDKYFYEAGTDADAIREMLKEELTGQELFQSPLMLDIILEAYKGLSIEEIQSFDSGKERLKHIFDSYITQMFKHRGKGRYSQKQSIEWLSWVAKKMSQNSQSVLLLRHLHINWLETFTQLSQLLIILSTIGFVIGFVIGGFIGTHSPIGVPGGSTNLGLFLGILSSILLHGSSKSGHQMKNIIESLRGTHLDLTKLVFDDRSIEEQNKTLGIIKEVVNQSSWSWMKEGIFLMGLLTGIFIGWTCHINQIVYIDLFGEWSWSWKNAAIGLTIGTIVIGLLGSLLHRFIDFLGLLLYAPVYMWKEIIKDIINGESTNSIINDSKGELIFGLIGGLYLGLVLGMDMIKLYIPDHLEYLWKSFYFSSFFVGEPLNDLKSSIILWWSWGDAFFGYLVGLILFSLLFIFFIDKLDSLLRHYTIRFILYRKNKIPWNLSSFLDYASERIFLRKVGDGYIFIHRILMEHLASLEPEQKEQKEGRTNL